MDWDAVRAASPTVIAECIKVRGMQRRLGARIHKFLTKVKRDFGKISLEHLRERPLEDVKAYLNSVDGECLLEHSILKGMFCFVMAPFDRVQHKSM